MEQLAASRYVRGWRVRLSGLQSRPDLDGTVAYVLGSTKGRVRVSTCPEVEIMRVLPEKLEILEKRVAGPVRMAEFRTYFADVSTHVNPNERHSLAVPILETARRRAIESGASYSGAESRAMAVMERVNRLSDAAWLQYEFEPHPAMVPARMMAALSESGA